MMLKRSFFWENQFRLFPVNNPEYIYFVLPTYFNFCLQLHLPWLKFDNQIINIVNICTRFLLKLLLQCVPARYRQRSRKKEGSWRPGEFDSSCYLTKPVSFHTAVLKFIYRIFCIFAGF